MSYSSKNPSSGVSSSSVFHNIWGWADEVVGHTSTNQLYISDATGTPSGMFHTVGSKQKGSTSPSYSSSVYLNNSIPVTPTSNTG